MIPAIRYDPSLSGRLPSSGGGRPRAGRIRGCLVRYIILPHGGVRSLFLSPPYPTTRMPGMPAKDRKSATETAPSALLFTTAAGRDL